jgi:hypothetical protein
MFELPIDMKIRGKQQYTIIGLILCCIGFIVVLKNIRSVNDCSVLSSSSHQSVTTASNERPPLTISDLPGYTGWARPSWSLAHCFQIQRLDSNVEANKNWTAAVRYNSNCVAYNDIQPWFFVRAYGPAVLTGIVEHLHGWQDSNIILHPTIAGQYTVEVVLTYSMPTDPDLFPQQHNSRLSYEGYLLPGFPLQMTVVTASNDVTGPVQSDFQGFSLPYCGLDQLTISKQSTAAPQWLHASWRVTSTNRHFMTDGNATMDHNKISLQGYISGYNSLGFTAAYEFTNCRLIESLKTSGVAVTEGKSCPDGKALLHLILIGDSVTRLQKDWIEQHISPDEIKISFVEIYGGVLRCSRMTGPNITTLVNGRISEINVPKSHTIVFFNTGMHDIHRLCGSSWVDDRKEYLTESELQLSCTTMYRLAIRELAETVLKIPAFAYIFQTTTAAWPKYGNYGVAWDPRYAQELPLDATFVERFNEIAINEISSLHSNNIQLSALTKRIDIVDAYWMTLSRPDNRETNRKVDLGKKLSHPGLEVIENMVLVWWQVVLLLRCKITSPP